MAKASVLAAAGVAAMLVAGCSSGPDNRVLAKVERVERTCQYNRTETMMRGSSVTSRKHSKINLDCSKDPKFLRIQRGEESRTRLFGHATAIVRYTSAADGQSHQARLKIEADEDEFYSLKDGQDLKVHVDPENGSIVTL